MSLKLYITDRGDPSVGIFSQTWEIQTPFPSLEETPQIELMWFKNQIAKIYGEFADGRLDLVFEGELEDELSDVLFV